MQARGRVPDKTGVWVGDRKIGAVGVRITYGISSHGIAFNVCTDLSNYKHIIPCGTPDKEVTSVQQELLGPLRGDLGASIGCRSSSGAVCLGPHQQPLDHHDVDLSVAQQHLLGAFIRVFQFDQVEAVDADAVLGN